MKMSKGEAKERRKELRFAREYSKKHHCVIDVQRIVEGRAKPKIYSTDREDHWAVSAYVGSEVIATYSEGKRI